MRSPFRRGDAVHAGAVIEIGRHNKRKRRFTYGQDNIREFINDEWDSALREAFVETGIGAKRSKGVREIESRLDALRTRFGHELIVDLMAAGAIDDDQGSLADDIHAELDG